MKRGQITIFIIASIAIVALVILFFLFRGNILPDIGGRPDVNPHSYMANCIEDVIRETLDTMGQQGGYTSNKLNLTFKFSDEEDYSDISYLCYQQNYYLPCINQEPVLITHLKKEIKNTISPSVRSCFDSLIVDMERKGIDVDSNYRGFDLDLQEDKVVINLDAEISATKSGETTKYSGIKSMISTKFYNLAVVAQEIVSQEARFCNFEQLGFMLIYPEFDIDKFRTGNSDTIYTLAHRESGEHFRFAVRSCVIPAGF